LPVTSTMRAAPAASTWVSSTGEPYDPGCEPAETARNVIYATT
jgi:hypothetical protein